MEKSKNKGGRPKSVPTAKPGELAQAIEANLKQVLTARTDKLLDDEQTRELIQRIYQQCLRILLEHASVISIKNIRYIETRSNGKKKIHMGGLPSDEIAPIIALSQLCMRFLNPESELPKKGQDINAIIRSGFKLPPGVKDVPSH